MKKAWPLAVIFLGGWIEEYIIISSFKLEQWLPFCFGSVGLIIILCFWWVHYFTYNPKFKIGFLNFKPIDIIFIENKSFDKIIEEVQIKLKEGWHLHGDLIEVYPSNIESMYYIQPMYKDRY